MFARRLLKFNSIPLQAQMVAVCHSVADQARFWVKRNCTFFVVKHPICRWEVQTFDELGNEIRRFDVRWTVDHVLLTIFGIAHV